MTIIDTATPLAAIRRRRALVIGDRTAYVTPDRVEVEIEPGRVQSFPLSVELSERVATLIDGLDVGDRPLLGREGAYIDAVSSTGWRALGVARLREIDGRRVLVVGARF